MSSMRRAKCRVCDRSSALNSNEHIYPHKGHVGRCPGSGRLAKGEPPCDFSCGPTAGRVAWPQVYSRDLPHASTYVCYDPEHQREAAAYVKAKTGHEGVFYGRETSVGGAR